MRILYHTWDALGGFETVDYFKQAGYEYKCIYNTAPSIEAKNYDPEYEEKLNAEFQSTHYDCLFSWNYFPIDARVCHDHGIPYISWTYDCPVYCGDISETLSFDTNFAFFFDKNQAREMSRICSSTVYYLPLPADISRVDRFKLTREEKKKYSTDISFVGQLYPSATVYIKESLSEYEKGYWDAMIDAQMKVYGQYFIPDLFTDEYITRLNTQLYGISNTHRLNMEKTMFSIPRNITSRERLLLLALLSQTHKVTLYCRENHAALKKVHFAGTVNNLTEAPKVFLASKINLNITLRSITSGIPLRVFDVMSCAGTLLSNYQPEFPEYFTQWKDIVWYESIIDAKEKADYLLKHEDECRRIGLNGFENVKNNFSFHVLFGKIFDAVFHESRDCQIF
jgi:spore maturation protein CgeB